jgi:hypothetical protein
MTTLEQQTALATQVGDRIFVDEPQYHIPELAERFAYKKDPGSSDTNHEYDSIRV